jgi:hypothetical protein
VKNYSMNVTIGFGDDGLFAWSRGHHPLDSFGVEVAKELDIQSLAKPGPPRHEWWRVVPDGDGGGLFLEAKPHSRGAFPVTYCDEWSEP